MINRTFKYRLFTNTNQERELAIALETHRRLYNTCLEYRKLAWEQFKTNISWVDSSRWFTQERKTNPWYAQINAASGHGTIIKLERSFQDFFRRCKQGMKPGYPKFKGKEHFNSITFSAHNGAILKGNILKIQYVGSVKI